MRQIGYEGSWKVRGDPRIGRPTRCVAEFVAHLLHSPISLSTSSTPMCDVGPHVDSPNADAMSTPGPAQRQCQQRTGHDHGNAGINDKCDRADNDVQAPHRPVTSPAELRLTSQPCRGRICQPYRLLHRLPHRLPRYLPIDSNLTLPKPRHPEAFILTYGGRFYKRSGGIYIRQMCT